MLLSALAVSIIWRGRAAGCGLVRERLPASGGAAAAAILAAALAATLLFLADPAQFGRLSAEDRPVEWASAFALLAGSGLFGWNFAVRLRSGVGRAEAALELLFAALLFVIAMEEVSWLQRLLDFRTPAEIAALNMQREFNFHNVHTDLSENAYYVGAAGFLILLPLIVDALTLPPAWRGLADFVPGRWVAAASAPLSIFNYGMWNVIPQQVAMMLTVLVMAAYAKAAAARGDRGESLLFAAMAAAITLGQAAFLARGAAMTQIWDASEYKELFIALGLLCFAIDATVRRRDQPLAAASYSSSDF
ncbi:MAG TPA: hypothetical protein VGW34_01375 [Allosphingosinicella sp.]|nr:hypothetical protein [Allosphingosinicella sp.]